jgi:dTDP-4-amino-4,6-dideoxygalactose transaminase
MDWRLDEGFVAHLAVVRTDDRDGLARHLKARGIPVDVHYPIADHRQPAWADRFGDVSLPHTEAACASVLTLPCFPEMTQAEIDGVCEALDQWAMSAARSAA